MAFRIFYHPGVRKEDLSSIPSNVKERIKRAIEERLLKEPSRYGQPLKRSPRGHRKLRAGDYRVTFRVDKNAVIVLKIGHRKEVCNRIVVRR